VPEGARKPLEAILAPPAPEPEDLEFEEFDEDAEAGDLEAGEAEAEAEADESAEHAAGEEGENGARRGRRRRRRRRGRGPEGSPAELGTAQESAGPYEAADDEEMPEAASAAGSEAEGHGEGAEASGEEDEAGARRRRRGRRGGRRRREREPGEERAAAAEGGAALGGAALDTGFVDAVLSGASGEGFDPSLDAAMEPVSEYAMTEAEPNAEAMADAVERGEPAFAGEDAAEESRGADLEDLSGALPSVPEHLIAQATEHALEAEDEGRGDMPVDEAPADEAPLPDFEEDGPAPAETFADRLDSEPTFAPPAEPPREPAMAEAVAESGDALTLSHTAEPEQPGPAALEPDPDRPRRTGWWQRRSIFR